MTGSDAPRRGRLRRAGGWARRRADPKVIVPIIITLGLIGYVSVIAAGPKSGGQIWDIVKRTWWVVLLLTIPYIAARAFLWRELLVQLGIDVPWRPALVTLAGGEIAKTVPCGVYVQNYLLARLEGFGELPVVRSTLATTAFLAFESLLALPVAVLIGMPHTPWLPFALLGLIAFWIALLLVLRLVVHYWEFHLAPGTPRWLRHILVIADEFLEAAADLFTWRTARALIPAAIYMLVYVGELYLIAGAVGVHSISFAQTMGIYAIVVLTVILVPIPAKLGTTELTGLTAFVAYGIPEPTAAIIMLGLRLLGTGMTMLVAGLILLVLRGEFRAAPPGDATAAGVRPAEAADWQRQAADD
jgi:uncharacterized membrane protein YbhN (UPF0104 family)